MSAKEAKEFIKKNIELKAVEPPVCGGQTVGTFQNFMMLRSEDVNIEIKCGHYRSQLKNTELIMTIFDLMLDELIK